MEAAHVSIGGESLALRGIVAKPRRHSQTYASKRRCGSKGCTTVLSVYNPSPFCWQHEEAHPFVLKIERKDKRVG
jgi:hypothetical protein